MGTRTIDQLPAASSLTGTEEIPAWQSGGSVKTTAQEIADLAPAGPTLPLVIGQGGTGQTTAQAALDALFAAVTKGSIWIGDGANVTPLAVAADGRVMTCDSGAPHGVSWQPPAGGLAIGQSVGGGTAGRLLFEGAGPVLADDANLTFVPSLGALIVRAAVGTQFPIEGVSGIYGTSIGADVLCLHGVNSSGCVVELGNAGVAFNVTDGVRTVTICDGTNNVLYAAGNPANWSGGSPTDVWIALDRIAAAVAGLLAGPIP